MMVSRPKVLRDHEAHRSAPVRRNARGDLAFRHRIRPTTALWTGGGDRWEITYFVSGTTTRIQHTTDANNNLITQQPTSYDLSSPSAGQTNAPSAGMYASEFTYRPTGSNTEVYTGGSAKTDMKVKTRVQWVSSNGTPAPSEVKLVLWSQTSAADPTPARRGVSNGLGHVAMESPERPTRTTKQSNGKRYRKFKVDGSGRVEFTTSLYAEVSMSGTGGSGVENCSFSVAPTDWAVSVASDDDGTYRRVSKSDGIHRISNYLEDDEVTSRGGDGMGYGDSSAYEPNSSNGRGFGSWFTLYTTGFGTMGFGYDISLTSSARLYGGGDGNDGLMAGYRGIPDSPAKPLKTFTVTGWASDRNAGISDTYTYTMKVHLLAEKEEKIATFDSDYLYWTNTNPQFANFHSGNYTPVCPISIENPYGTDEKYKITLSNTITGDSGWESSGGGSAELNFKIAKIIFNGTFVKKGSAGESATKSIEGDTTVSAGQRYEMWRCPVGVLDLYTTSRWGEHGYTGDGLEFVLSGYRESYHPRRRPVGAPVEGPPHLGQS